MIILDRDKAVACCRSPVESSPARSGRSGAFACDAEAGVGGDRWSHSQIRCRIRRACLSFCGTCLWVC